MTKSTYTVYADRTIVGGLSDLATTLADVTRGYEEMEQRAEGTLLPAVKSLRERHERDAAEILALLEKTGGRPDETGSMMGAVHQAVATARDWFGDLDGSTIDAVVDGEERVLEQYNSTLSETSGTPDVHEVVVRQRDGLRKEVHTLKTKAAS